MPSDQEAVVAQIRARIERNGRKENYDRLLQFVGNVNGHVQSRIIVGALGALHPVDDAVALRVRARLASAP